MHKRQQLELVKSGEALSLPTDQNVKQLILSDQTSLVVKTALVNLVLRNSDSYCDIQVDLGKYIQEYLVRDYLGQRKREVD